MDLWEGAGLSALPCVDREVQAHPVDCCERVRRCQARVLAPLELLRVGMRRGAAGHLCFGWMVSNLERNSRLSENGYLY
jgi:hypothetical protein